MNLIWVGKYQSDISYTNQYFSGSITYYGDGTNKNVCCCSQYTRIYNKKNFISFIIKNIKDLLGQCKFIFYSQSYAYEVINLFPECKDYIININSKELIDWLSNKTLVRLWVKNIVNVPPFCAISGSECIYSNFKALFPKYNKFVVQDNFSSGGIGSFIIENNQDANEMLIPYDIYLVSPLLESSFSVNMHLLIGKNEQTIFPLSIQIIEPSKSPFIFRGSDFIEAKKIPHKIINELRLCGERIGKKLAGMGYRGICGLDFIIQNNIIYFIEINPRFQGSSFLINRVLAEKNFPSLYELNERAFCDKSIQIPQKKLENLNVEYSYYKVKCNKKVSKQFIAGCLDSVDIDIYFMDGLINEKVQINSNDYLFRFISKRNIVSLNPNKQINIYQNLIINQIVKLPVLSKTNWTDLKSSLLIQGIKIDKSAVIALEGYGGFQDGTFDAIDLRFSNNLVINCPLKIPFINFSPYTL